MLTLAVYMNNDLQWGIVWPTEISSLQQDRIECQILVPNSKISWTYSQNSDRWNEKSWGSNWTIHEKSWRSMTHGPWGPKRDKSFGFLGKSTVQEDLNWTVFESGRSARAKTGRFVKLSGPWGLKMDGKCWFKLNGLRKWTVKEGST